MISPQSHWETPTNVKTNSHVLTQPYAKPFVTAAMVHAVASAPDVMCYI